MGVGGGGQGEGESEELHFEKKWVSSYLWCKEEEGAKDGDDGTRKSVAGLLRSKSISLEE